jgi:hypothetical protein
MAVAVERAPLTGDHAQERGGLRPVVVLRVVGALAAVSGMALALFFAVGPIHITVHDQVAVEQASGQDGSTLTATNQTRIESRQVTCVPYLQFDSSSDQNRACTAKVRGPLRLALVGLVVFLAGSALWIVSKGDRAVGFSGRRQVIRSSLS